MRLLLTLILGKISLKNITTLKNYEINRMSTVCDFSLILAPIMSYSTYVIFSMINEIDDIY